MASAKGARAGETDFDDTGFAKTVDRVRDNVKTFANSATENAAEGVNHLVDQGADGVKAVAGKVPQVSYWADEQIELARDRVRAEPIKMMAIAAGVGALLGAIFLRR
ncbi:MAG: hypothetical protein IT548_08965 [Alphaproteobacteria bacterium]|nr:hypothetical protein [Alphaproteobacteria bacterium]